ncbi:MAG: VanW family protein [Deltaproteobacteria bacterium]|nr:VanW family protein [Deltaproteobacteria bacterium]
MRKKYFFLILIVLLGFTSWAAQALYRERNFSLRRASFLTLLSSRSAAQKKNIGLAASKINGVIIYPGKVFSLNEGAGPYASEEGFLKERTFEKEAFAFKAGGGVCQLASTLYNAALQAGLEIEERTQHSRPVQSVPWGQDATLVYGLSDLKIKNPFEFPLKIVSMIKNEELKVEVWGK